MASGTHTRASRSRRWLLSRGGAAGAGFGAAFLAACGGGDSKDTAKDTGPSAGTTAAGGQAVAAGQPKRGGTTVMSLTTSFSDVMDPHTSLNQAPYIWSYIGNTALRLNREATEIQPELVQKWEIPGDGSEMLFKVRPNVKWHDKPPVNGRLLDAEDIAYNLMRIAGKLNPNEVARFQRRTALEGMTKAEAVDASTVKVTFDRPRSAFLNGVTDFRNQFVPRDLIEKGAKYEDPNSLVGTGAFIADTWKDNERSSWKRNPNYWKEGKPYIDSAVWVWIPDKLGQLSALAKGDIDVFFNPTKADRDIIKRTVPDAQEEKWVFGNWNHLRMNTQRKPFEDPRVRRAVHLVLNYKALGDAFYGDGYWDYTGPSPAVFPESITSDEIAKMPGWNAATKEADIKTAKDLMTAAGFPDGAISFKILQATTSTASAYYDYTIRGIDQLKAVWPAMKPELEIPPDGAAFSRRQVQGDFEMIGYVNYPYPSSVIELTAQYHSTGSRNYGKFKDAKVDSLLDTASGQLDAKQRAATLQEAQKLIIDLMPTITVNMPRIIASTRGRVKGMKDTGGRADGGVYDFLRHTDGMSIG